jgi:hypothetical protein
VSITAGKVDPEMVECAAMIIERGNVGDLQANHLQSGQIE